MGNWITKEHPLLGLIVAIFLVILALGGMLYILPGASPEVQLGLVIVLAVVLMMALLFIMAMGFQKVNLSDPRQALGLPEGTIRALIALILIMLFVIVGIYLFRVVGEGLTTVHNLTQSEITALGARVVKKVPVPNQDGLFDATLAGSLSDEGARLAQQLITTIGTLVVAVAGFYFGSSAVTGVTKGRTQQRLVVSTSTPLPKGSLNSPYKVTLFAGGGTPSYTWELDPGSNLPQGLSLDENSGEITGTPTLSGKSSFTVRLHDSANNSTAKQFELEIA